MGIEMEGSTSSGDGGASSPEEECLLSFAEKTQSYKGHREDKQKRICCMKPSWKHLAVMFVLHTAVMFGAQYFVMQYELPAMAKMLLPKHLSSFVDITKLASALKTFIKYEPNAIFAALAVWYFYFQLWHIPLTWVIGLLMGAVMPSVFEAFLL